MKKNILLVVAITLSFSLFSQSHWIRIELDAKQMLNPSCNLNEGMVEDNKVYAHLGLCSCLENEPFGPANRDCTSDELNKLFCTTQITPFQSRVWQHVVGNWDEQAADDGTGLMTYEGDSVWSIEFVVEDYFSSMSQDNDSSILFNSDLTPYTLGVVFRNKDGFYSGRDNGCNDIFITGIADFNPQVIQSTDLSIFPAIKVTMSKASDIENPNFDQNDFKLFPNPTFDKRIKMELNSSLRNPFEIKIYNSIGQEVFYSNYHSIDSNHLTLDLTFLNKGIYFISFESSDIQKTKKLILQ